MKDTKRTIFKKLFFIKNAFSKICKLDGFTIAGVFSAASGSYRKYAFTLAEVLVTLGIIGVVASMTLPSLVQKQQEKVTVARVKKAYSILQEAFLMAVQKNGTPDQWGATGMYEASSHIFTARKFIPYMKVTADCTGMNTRQVYKKCTTVYNDSASFASIKIADGTTVIFRRWNGLCNSQFGSSKMLKNVCGSISIDTNATGKPNVEGKDIFSFYLTKNGIYPVGTEMDNISMKKYCTRSMPWGQLVGSGFYNGMACTAWVLYNENMDYLYCDIDWDSGKKSCKK